MMLPSPSAQPNPLKRALEDAEAELRRRLHEACEAEAKGVTTESTQEIRRLEDALLAAAVAAKQTIKMRSHLSDTASVEQERSVRIDPAADRKRESSPEAGSDSSRSDSSRSDSSRSDSSRSTAEQDERHTSEVREFRDGSGRPWRAWPVIPGLNRASTGGRSFLGDFRNGWICFESLDSPARRRLPSPLPNWMDITDEELRLLLAQAIDAPGRAKPGRDTAP
jgi:hypothetical protein